jgi:hypothetical protein
VLALLLNGSSPALADAPPTRLPWQGGTSYLNGVDYPWVHYGSDFGGNTWGAYGVHDPATSATVDADMARMEQQGVHSLRWWLFADGRAGIQWDSGGLPAGLDQYVFADLDAAVALAQRHHIYLDLVLTDVSLLYAPAYTNGVQLGGRPYLLSTAAGRQALLSKVFLPVFQRYGRNPQILAYEVMNEPEWVIPEDKAVNQKAAQTVSLATFRTFVRQVAAAVHADTQSYVTVGSAAASWLSQWRGLGLDFYSVHFYDWMHPWPDVDVYDSGCAALHLDAPVVIGEYPPGSATASFRQYLDNWFAGGCAGAMAWSFRGVDGAGAPDPQVMAAWNSGHGPAAPAQAAPSSTPGAGSPSRTAPGRPAPAPTAGVPPAPSASSSAPGDVRFDFQDGSRQGWAVSWGVGIAARSTLLPHDSEERALLVRLEPTSGSPAIAVQSGLEGLSAGRTVSYQVWAPRAASATVTPYVTDLEGREHFGQPRSLAEGWNMLQWRVPAVDGVASLGLQFDNPAGWGGRLYLDEVAW